jgi:hypothetical protein
MALMAYSCKLLLRLKDREIEKYKAALRTKKRREEDGRREMAYSLDNSSLLKTLGYKGGK